MHKEANSTLKLSRSRSTQDHRLNKLGSSHIPNGTYQVPRSSIIWFWRRFLKGFYHIWAWWPSWSCDQDNLNKLRSPLLKSLHMKFEFNWPSSPILKSLHMKFEFNWPSGFREDVWKCWLTDERRSHWYANSSPRSLRLRWAKNHSGSLHSFFFAISYHKAQNEKLKA